MITIIDYGIGNLGSVKNALDKLGADSVISKSETEINKATGLIFPGVGSATEGIKNLRKSGLDKVIIDQIKKKKPILGICLGMQLLFTKSEEGNIKCLDIIGGKVKKYKAELKIPQIGWNQVKIKNSKLKIKNLFDKIPNNSSFYFVNSYYCLPKDKSVVIGETEYGINFCSLLVKNNITATQFHPEKSGPIGLQLIKNWLKIL
jgi:glutamine amidotransferase